MDNPRTEAHLKVARLDGARLAQMRADAAAHVRRHATDPDDESALLAALGLETS